MTAFLCGINFVPSYSLFRFFSWVLFFALLLGGLPFFPFAQFFAVDVPNAWVAAAFAAFVGGGFAGFFNLFHALCSLVSVKQYFSRKWLTGGFGVVSLLYEDCWLFYRSGQCVNIRL